MKNIFKYIFAVLCTVSLLSCDRDDDTLVAYLESDTTISTLESDIVLTVGNADGLALTIYWDELGTAYLNNPNAQMTSDVVVNAVQFSLSQDFETVSEVSVDSDDLFAQFTVSELNVIVIGLGAEGGVATPVYVRLSTSLGDNTEPTYSNVLTLTVTGYTIDMSYITLRGVSGGEYTGTDITISATDTEGEYAGFAYISSDWWNFFFVEGDGTIWGSVEDSGPFDLDKKSDISSWNIWFPTYGGLYYIEMSSNDAEWSCQLISGVTLTAGSAEAVSMTYSKSYNAYSLVFTTTADSEAIEVAYDATLYNYTTGEGSTTTVNHPLVAASDGTFSVGAVGTSTGITAGTAGTYTLALYLDDTTWKLSEGSVELGGGDEEESGWGEDADYVAATTDYLYIYSSGSTVGTLAATSTGVYEGFFYMTSYVNFNFGDNIDSTQATVTYGSYPSSDDGALYRLYCSSDGWSIWWDFNSAACVYLTVDTNERSWSYMEITDVDIVGIGDVWTADSYPMTLGTDGLWTANVTLPDSNLWGPWGIQFLLNENWSYVYAPATGNTLVAGSAATPEGTYTEGTTYTISIDLYNMTYTIAEASEDSGEVTYDEYLYVFYSWGSSGWQEAYAGTLWSPSKDGEYTGFFSSANSWTEPYCQFSYGSTTTAQSGTHYYVVDNATLNTSGGASGWVSTLGVSELTVSLANMTSAVTYIGYPYVNNVTSSTSTIMAFDDSTNYTWSATCTFSAGDSFTIGLGESSGSYTYTYGGADGVLSTSGSAISVATAGTYLVTVDLRDASNLTYTVAVSE